MADANFTNGTNWSAEITTNKTANKTITIPTKDKYVNKDIVLTIKSASNSNIGASYNSEIHKETATSTTNTALVSTAGYTGTTWISGIDLKSSATQSTKNFDVVTKDSSNNATTWTFVVSGDTIYVQ